MCQWGAIRSPWAGYQTRSSKTVGDRENLLRVTCQATRGLSFGAIAAAQWLTIRPVEARVREYPADRPTDQIVPDQSELGSII